MPRPKKIPTDDPLKDFRERVKQIEAGTTSEHVILDTATYVKLVSFIEHEGCSLKEALRRSVKIGVEALLQIEDIVDDPILPASFEVPWTHDINKPNKTEINGQYNEYEKTDGILKDHVTDYAMEAPPGI